MRPVNPATAGEEMWTQVMRRLAQVERQGTATVLLGTAAPTAADGADGDYWLDADRGRLYGPKGRTAGGQWPTVFHGLSSNRAWTALTLQNSWVNFGGAYAPAAYRLDGDWVRLRGVIARAAAVAYPTVVGTLPVGMRPAQEEVFLCSSGSTGFNPVAFTRVHITTAGAVTLVDGNTTNSATNTSLSGVGFSIA